MEKLKQKKFLIFISIFLLILISFLLSFGFYLFKIKKGEKKEIPVSTPKKEETTEELLKRLTPTTAKPLAEEEKKETEELLEKLTPKNPKPKIPEEIKDEKKLLKKLTP
jgi:ABC-type Na+ efflux pump permease subunit